VTADLLEAKIAATESTADLADETKTRLLSLYREALSTLDEAASHRESAEAFQEALQTAPVETQAIREDMDESNVAEPAETLGVDASTSLRDMESVLQREKADYAVADTRRAELSKRPEEEAARPAAIRQRLQAASEEQDEILAQQQLTAPSEDASAEAQARRWAMEARGEVLSAEIEMLDRELLSHPARVELLAAKRDKAAEAKRLEAEGRHPRVVRLADQNAALSNESAETVAQLDEATEQAEATDRLARQLEDDFKSAQEVIAIRGSSLNEQLGNLLRQQRQSLPDRRSFEREAREREVTAGQDRGQPSAPSTRAAAAAGYGGLCRGAARRCDR
jgi:potassium efflux system protein